MLIKILGVLDIILGAILIFGTRIDFPTGVLLFLGLVLLAKSSLGMWMDFGSWIDTISGLIFLLMIVFSIPQFIGIILGILLVQKGFFSFI